MNDIDQTIQANIITQIKCSTLIVHSQNDKNVDLSHPENAHQQIENSQYIKFQNLWGHLFWVGEDSKKNIESILRFIEG
jgi:esterase/lipase